MADPAKLFRMIIFSEFIMYCNSLTTSILQYYIYDVITFIHRLHLLSLFGIVSISVSIVYIDT